MLPEIIYRKASDEFGVPVGVAKILGFKKKEDHIEEITSESYKQLSKELEIYRLKSTNPRLKSELSIYNRAYKNINGETNTNKSKSTKVHPNR